MSLELCEELVKLLKEQAVRSAILSKYTFQRSYALDVNTWNPKSVVLTIRPRLTHHYSKPMLT